MANLRSNAGYRIAILYSAAFAVAILLLGIAVYFAADAEFRSQRNAAIADELDELMRIEDPAALRRAITDREIAGPTGGFVYALFDAYGKRIAGDLQTAMPEPGIATISFNDPHEGADPAVAHTAVRPNGDRVVVAVDSEAIEKIDATILALFGGAFVVVLIIGGAGALILGGYLRRRLAVISDTAQSIIAGDVTRRVAISQAGDEFDQAGQALNAMLDRISQLMENLRQVSSDVAHDLRTPLLRLRNQLEQVGTVDGAAERAIELGDEMLLLFGSLLRIAEVEGGALSRSFAVVELSSLIEDVGESFYPAITDSGRVLTSAITPRINLLGDRELLAQAAANLLDNARVHTPEGTAIRLVLKTSDDMVHLSVVDNGPGVPNGDREKILQRFYRAERSRTTPGNGLGLSLVTAVAAAHGGKVIVGAQEPGLAVTLVLPRLGP